MKQILNLLLLNNIFNNIDIQFAEFISNYIKNNNYYLKNIILFIAAYLSFFTRQNNICLPFQYIYYLKILDEYKTNPIYKIIYKKFYTLNKKFKINNILLFKKIFYKFPNIINKGNQKYITPIVFYKNKLYLYKYWFYENKILEYLLNNINKYNNSYKIKINKKCLNYLNNLNIDKWKKIAILSILINKITFIIGYPGSGKSFLILFIISTLLINNNLLNIQILTLNHNSKNKIIKLLIKSKYKLLINKVKTIHNFLNLNLYNKYIFYDNIIKKHQYIDIIIIDEIFLVDIHLLYYLLYALPLHIKIIFIGDPYQLHSIEVGGLLKSLYNNIKYNDYSLNKIKFLNFFLKNYLFNQKYKILPKSLHSLDNLSDSICYLKKNYRFNKYSGIKKLTDGLINNNISSIINILEYKKFKDLVIFPLDNQQHYNFFLHYYIKLYYNYWFKLKLTKTKFLFNNILKYDNKIKLLCLLNDGPFGKTGLNHNLNLILKNKIMTNYLKLNNNHLIINNIFSFTLTIHKAQGLEFEHVILILPNYFHKLLNKQLIFTAITRAKYKLSIFTNNEIFIKAILNNSEQLTGVKDKLINYK